MPSGAEIAAEAARKKRGEAGPQKPSLIGLLLKIYFNKEKLIMTETKTVEVKSAFLSKINWVQVVPYAASLLAYVGLEEITADTLLAIIMGVYGVQSVTTVLLRTYYTKTVTPSAAAK